MNLTPVQERRLQQVNDEIVFLEKQIMKKGIGFAVWLSLVSIIVGNLVVYGLEFLLGHKSFTNYIHENSWTSILCSWIIFLLAIYFFVVRGNYQALRLKRKELAELHKKYGLTEENKSLFNINGK